MENGKRKREDAEGDGISHDAKKGKQGLASARDQGDFISVCNECKQSAGSMYHCPVCDDYNVCGNCYSKIGHNHKMEESPDPRASPDPREAKRLSIQRCIQSLIHACRCQNATCCLPCCQKMKRVVQHIKVCMRKISGECPICKQVIALCCYHAKQCQEQQCLIPYCPMIKHKLLLQQQLRQRIAAEQRVVQRMHSAA